MRWQRVMSVACCVMGMVFFLRAESAHADNSLVPSYGHWGGPGYSGGIYVKKDGKMGTAAPIDAMDEAFMYHDYAYAEAEKLEKQGKKDEAYAIKYLADFKLVQRLRSLPENPKDWPRKDSYEKLSPARKLEQWTKHKIYEMGGVLEGVLSTFSKRKEGYEGSREKRFGEQAGDFFWEIYAPLVNFSGLMDELGKKDESDRRKFSDVLDKLQRLIRNAEASAAKEFGMGSGFPTFVEPDIRLENFAEIAVGALPTNYTTIDSIQNIQSSVNQAHQFDVFQLLGVTSTSIVNTGNTTAGLGTETWIGSSLALGWKAGAWPQPFWIFDDLLGIELTLDKDAGKVSGTMSFLSQFPDMSRTLAAEIGGSLGSSYTSNKEFSAVLGGSDVQSGSLSTAPINEQLSEWTTWGTWSVNYTDSVSGSSFASGQWIAGKTTDPSYISNLISQNFTGTYVGGANLRTMDPATFNTQNFSGQTNITVNFGPKTFSGALDFGSIKMDVAGNISTTNFMLGNVTKLTDGATIINNPTSELEGRFFGPVANDIGGTVRVHGDGTVGNKQYRAVFAGSR